MIAQALPNECVTVKAAVARPFLTANKRHRLFLTINLLGCSADSAQRPPLNIAVVVDCSSSMEGEKMKQAKAGLLSIISHLKKGDFFSLVSFANRPKVLIVSRPNRIASSIPRKIKQLQANGMTALYAGLQSGVNQVRKTKSSSYINRVILISDGDANIGPMNYRDFAKAAEQFKREGISVTTLGLGKDYGEDVLCSIARSSQGNHANVNDPKRLRQVIDEELRNSTHVVAFRAQVKVQCPPCVRPLRVLGPQASIAGNAVEFSYNQLFAKQKRGAVIELELAPHLAGEKAKVAQIDVSYIHPTQIVGKRKRGFACVTFTKDPSQQKSKIDKPAMEQVITALANLTTKLALELRDLGRIKEARDACYQNQRTIEGARKMYNLDNTKNLQKMWQLSGEYANQMDETNWPAQRKRMKRDQFLLDSFPLHQSTGTISKSVNSSH